MAGGSRNAAASAVASVTVLATGTPHASRTRRASFADGRQPERHRAWRVPGSVLNDHLDTGQSQRRAVGELDHLVWLGEGQAAEHPRARLRPEPPGGVAEQRAVGGMDVGGDVLRAAYRGH